MVVDWSGEAAKLPIGKEAESAARRDRFWQDAAHGAASLSLLEVEDLVSMILGYRGSSSAQSRILRESTYVTVHRAFSRLRGSLASLKGHEYLDMVAADRLERDELSDFLNQLAVYYKLYAELHRSDMDPYSLPMVDFTSFRRLLPKMAVWGATVPARTIHITEAFDSIPDRRGNCILFDELCEWALNHRHVAQSSQLDGSAASMGKPRTAPARPLSSRELAPVSPPMPRPRLADPAMCYHRKQPVPSGPTWYLRSTAPGRYPAGFSDGGPPPPPALVVTPLGLSVTTMLGPGRPRGGLPPELATALDASFQKLSIRRSQRRMPPAGGRSKYLRFKDAPPTDVDAETVKRHRSPLTV